MTRLFLLLISCATMFAQRTPMKINGVVVNNPNLTNTASLTWSVVGSDVSGTAAGGDNIWTNDNGTLSPSTGTSISIESQSLSLGTNFTSALNSTFRTGYEVNTTTGQYGIGSHVITYSGNQPAVGWTWTFRDAGFAANSLVGVGIENQVQIEGGNKAIYFGSAGQILEAADFSAGPYTGQVVAMIGVAEGGASTQIGVTGYGQPSYDNQITLGIVGTASTNALGTSITGTTSVGGYFEVLSSPNLGDPTYESGVLLLDNRDTELPIMVARSNSVQVAIIDNTGQVRATSGAFTNSLTVGGVSVSTFTGTANTVIGSGTTDANDIAIFTDNTHTNIARSTSAGRLGDDSAASYVFTLANSGTDVLLTSSSALLAISTPISITGAANAVGVAVSGGSTTGSGTTKGGTFSHTANTSGNIDGAWTFQLVDTASGASTFHSKWLGGAAGTTVLMSLDKSGVLLALGNLMTSANLIVPSVGQMTFDTRTKLRSGADGDLQLGNFANTGFGTLQLGPSDASPNSATIKSPNGSGTDIAGGNLTIAGGQSTGTGRGGALIGQTSPSGSTGSSANAYSERYHFPAKAVTLTSATDTTVATIAVPTGKFVGAKITVTVFATDGTDHQARTLSFTVSAVNKVGTITDGFSTPDESIAASSGTLTATVDTEPSGSTIAIQINADSSLTETTLSATVAIEAINSNDTAAVTEI